MKKNVFLKSLAASLVFLGFITPVYAQDQNFPASTKKIQRSFLNLSFEQFKTGVTVATEYYEDWAIYDQENVIGWKTTAATTKTTDQKWNAIGEKNYRGIEIWDETKGSYKTDHGQYFAELNAHSASTLYQNVCLLPTDKFDWSLKHLGRKNSQEKMRFIIAEEINDTFKAGSSSATAITPTILKDVSGTLTATHNSWTEHSSTNAVDVSSFISAAKNVSFGFQAIGGTIEGNFLDSIKLKLNPAVEFSALSGETFENNNNKYQSIDFKMIGLVEKDFVVSFVVDLNKSVEQATIAKHNEDYKIYSKNGDKYTEIPVTLNKATNQLEFSYTVKYDANLDYAQGVIVKGLVVELIDNDLLDGDKVIPFGLNSVQSGSVKIMGTEVCGTAPISEFSYKILDNDTDLVVKKNLLSTQVIPNNEVSYEVIVENKSSLLNTTSTARAVFLKDSLLSNLEKNENTELTCEVVENDGVTGTCPTMTSTKDAAAQLFSEQGLSIGNLPAKAKLKFTVSKLKIAASEKGATNYKNLIANKAQVTTTSNDIDLSNNEAIAQNSYPFLSDLSNSVAGGLDDTGKGLFYIAEGGRTGTIPLLTKAMDKSGQTYFPLLIENKASYTQDYRLHASRGAIVPTIQGDYSSLDLATIQTFTTDLNIKFYPVTDANCKAGLTANPISQLNVAAGGAVQLCAEVTATESATLPSYDIWFAIESVQTGLGDIIKNQVTYQAVTLRSLILVNDQQAQVNIGGTYVFAHRLSNEGSIAESNLKFELKPLSPQDNFSYTLFLDHNNNGLLDTGDEQVQIATRSSLAIGGSLSLLVKVQAPTTATNGMRSQVQLVVSPTENVNDMLLVALSNLDTITVGSNQLVLQKTQFKQTGCADMSKDQVQAANYSLGQMSIGRNDCIIYRIEASNIGAEKLTSIVINDMYPHYSTSWSSNGALPMTDSGDNVLPQVDKVETKISQLLPGEKKSLYFGIKLQ